MNKILFLFFVVSLLCLCSFTGCGKSKNGLDPKYPVTLTMWHNFGGDMQKTMDSLIDEFNSTIGKEQGIIINVTTISSSTELQEKLGMIVNGDPGAPKMPDITTCYPKTAILFQQKDMLVNLDTYFSEQELSLYITQFVDEGRLGDDGLYVFPFAKSTEILYVNQTFFDIFAEATGVTMDSFTTFEGIADAAIKYYEWTDDQTPDILNDGKAFFAADSWFNIAQAGMKQQGFSLIEDESLVLTGSDYENIWNFSYQPAIQGGFAIYDGYSSDLSKSGDLLCSTGSSAGILFYGDTITYADNTVEKVKYSILPYPVFSGGKKVALQRGNGLCVAKSTAEKEYAASLFIKWFTTPEQNMRFISSTGYLPVTNTAFQNDMTLHIETVEDERIKEMLLASRKMYEEYTFFVAPTFDSFDGMGKAYESDLKKLLWADREVYLQTESADIDTMASKGLLLFQKER